jgi:hypothetical protein
MKHFYRKLFTAIFIICAALSASAQVNVTATVGTTTGSYGTVKAAFDAINAGTHKGVVTLSLTASTTETATAVLQSSGTGASSYTSVILRPASGVNATISSVGTEGVIKLNGADNVTIDGSNVVGGTTRNLTITTTSAALVPVIWVGSAGATNAATGNTIQNCIIRGNTAKGSFACIFSGSGTTLGNLADLPNNNLTIMNNALLRAQSGVLYGGEATTYDDGLIITRNDIGGSVTADKITENGILAGYIKNFQISRNNIVGILSDTSTTASGIFLTGDLSNGAVFYNKIRDIKNTDTDGYGCNGIWLAAFNITSNVTVHNNFISDIAGYGYLGDSEADNGYGMVVTDGGGYKIWFNTIVMNTNQTVAGYPAAFNVTNDVTAAAAIDLRNNILVNTQTQAGDRYAINSEAAAVVFSPINNNAYYTSGTNIAYIAGADRTNLAGIQAGFGGNANSVVTLPVFVSPTDLHLVAGSNAGVDNKGTPVTVTTDIDEETRSVTPDLGADEMPPGADTNAPGITYTALGFACSTSDRIVTATIIDASGVPTTGTLVPRIYYKKSTGGTWYSKPGTLTSGTATNGVWSFTITVADMGGVAVGDVIQYYVIAQDIVATPNIASSPAGAVASNVNTVTTPPSTPSSYSINGALSGSFNVGTGGTYTTLTSAVAAYNSGCLAGPVTFSLTAAVYQAGETFPLVIMNNAGASSVNSLTIKPATGVNVSINADSAAFILDGANYVTIDGSNTVGGTTKNLTMNKASVFGATVILQNGASNNTIKNSVIKGVATGTGVVTIGGSTAAAGNNNNLFQNNDITKGATSPVAGIFNVGTSGKPNTGNSYIGNRIFDFGLYGFIDGNGTVGFSSNTLFEKNEIYETAPQAGSLTGIMINNLTGISGMTISKNNIHDLNTTTTTGTVVGIDLYDAVSASVVNNMVAIANNTTSVRGIAQETTAGATIKVQYNTVSLSGSPSGTAVSYAFLKNYTSANDDVRNNIFVNTRTTTGTGNQYAIGNVGTGTMISNYNDLYSAGNSLNFLGRKGTTDYITLANWQTGSAGDANSVNILPVFVAANDLHLSTTANLTLDNKGTPIAGITTDIDNDTRSASTPDLGADEFTASTVCVAPAITGQPAAQTVCAGSNASFTVTATGTNLTYQWRKNTVAITGSTATTFSLTNVSSSDAANYDVIVSNGCGTVTSTSVALVVNPLPVITTAPVAVTVCALNPATFTVAASGTGTLTYQWKKAGLSIAGATNATYTITSAAVGDAGQYSVTISNGTCSITSTPVQLTVNACTAVPSLSADVTSAVLMPSVVTNNTRVKIVVRKAMRIGWTVSDAAGNVVMRFNTQAIAGNNEFPIALDKLAGGTYQLTASSSNGRIATLRFVKQ